MQLPRIGWMLWRTCTQTARLFGSHRRLFLPFLVTAFVELLLLGGLWLAPHPPFAKILAPPVRYFFGDRMLHYPWHLWFLYHAMPHTSVVASTLVGAFMTGMACVMVRQLHEGRVLSFRAALAGRQVRYGRVVLLWLIAWAVTHGAMSLMAHTLRPTGAAAWIQVGALLILQALFVYLIPAAVFTGAAWWNAMLRGVRETLEHPLGTLLLVGLVLSPLVVFSVVCREARVAQWMARFEPELALVVVGARWLLSLLTDAVLTVAAAHLWWLRRAVAPAPARSAETRDRRPETGDQRQATRNRKQTTGKKELVPAASIVALAVAGLIAASGCSASYSGERLFWQAQRQAAPILNARSGAPRAEQLTAALASCELVITRVPQTAWAPKAHLLMGALHLRQRQYDKAREVYALVVQNYHRYQDLCLQARMARAKSYEAEGRWQDAADAYYELADYYPWTAAGLQTPLAVAEGYRLRRQTEDATKAYQRAVGRYTKLLPASPTKELTAKAKTFLAAAQQRLGKWPEAARLLDELVEAPDGVDQAAVLISLGVLYQTKLNDATKARQTYERLLNTFPQHPVSKIAKARLEQMGVAIPADLAVRIDAAPTSTGGHLTIIPPKSRSFGSYHGLWPWTRSGFRPTGGRKGTTGHARGAP